MSSTRVERCFRLSGMLWGRSRMLIAWEQAHKVKGQIYLLFLSWHWCSWCSAGSLYLRPRLDVRDVHPQSGLDSFSEKVSSPLWSATKSSTLRFTYAPSIFQAPTEIYSLSKMQTVNVPLQMLPTTKISHNKKLKLKLCVCTYSAWPSWTCLCCSARISVSWELHCAMKWRTRSPAPLVNIPVEAEERPSDWKHDKSHNNIQCGMSHVIILKISIHNWIMIIKFSLCQAERISSHLESEFTVGVNTLKRFSTVLLFYLACTLHVLTSAPDAIASTVQPCSGTNSRAAFRIRTWSCSSVSYSSPCSPLWSW